MAEDLIRDLKMAEISLAKVKDSDTLIERAQEVMEDYRVDLRVKDEIQDSIDTIDQAADYQITPKMVNKVDTQISTSPSLVVKEGTVTISGTENFGLTMSPTEWRKTRREALKSILDETYRNIKRWANQLAENFHNRWVELVETIDTLESRKESAKARIDKIKAMKDGCQSYDLNETLSKTISKNGRVLSGDIANGIKSEVSTIMANFKLWEFDQVRFKNSIIRYFGNDNSTNITDLVRYAPKTFNIKVKLDDDNEGMLVGRKTPIMLGGFSFQSVVLNEDWVKKNIKTPQDNTTYADSLSLTGECVIPEQNQIGVTHISTLSVTQMQNLVLVIENIINKLAEMNNEDSPINFDADDVKDILKHLKASGVGDSRGYQYGLITADYQFNVNKFKSEVAGKLIVLTSHLITLLNQNLECYQIEE